MRRPAAGRLCHARRWAPAYGWLTTTLLAARAQDGARRGAIHDAHGADEVRERRREILISRYIS